ncbi:circularly permutated Ras protein 1 isoform X2 [Kryptolebias marmoratus]|uniref:circularly permutated Ras protein 1 isoform X2 n=1 Tax=Kryptolebias marmoratus TaxID=37003 RepID=UPI0007F92775|nr:circularly permutated Ras protein 1 isoform X2 [Kryptolebias marmoratus]
MEFACGYVYVKPSAAQKDALRPKANVIKLSALLPPVTWARPSTHPPSPPKDSAKATKPNQPAIYETNFDGLFKKSREGQVTKSSPHYENAEFHKKSGAASSKNVVSQLTTSHQKKALLPPHMKAGGNTGSYSQPLTSRRTNNQILNYDEPKQKTDVNRNFEDPNYTYNIPEGSGGEVKPPGDAVPALASGPGLPPRPSFMDLIPQYLQVIPSSHPSSSSPSPAAPSSTATASANKAPLSGNPNVVLVSLGKLLSEEKVQPVKGKPTSCSKCGSVLNSCYDNEVKVCYFCQSWDWTSSASTPTCHENIHREEVFLLSPDEQHLSAAEALLLFCIDASGSMSLTSEVLEGKQVVQRSRLEFVQQAVLQSVQRLSEQQPEVRVGLITFNYQVTMHGYEKFKSLLLSGDDLNDSKYLKEAADNFPSPPPLSQTKEYLRSQIINLSANGTTALGPAALLAIRMASRHPGSKVIICTDGKANAKLGNLEEEDNDARTLLSSNIFYKDLGEYAANQGVVVSVLSIEGTDCRLDELGRLADRTGGKVVIANPSRLHLEFEEIIQSRIIATHCAVTLLLPKSLRLRGEREAGHKGTREVGNVNLETEITIQFGANKQNTEALALAPGSRVAIQLQIRYRRSNRQMMLRVMTVEREVTDDSSAVLSSLSLAILQLNSLQASATLAVRGRFQDAKKEGELQRKLIERAMKYSRNAEDKQTFKELFKTMEPIHNNIHTFTRNKCVISDSQTLTDAGAALFFTIKHSNRKSILLEN